MRKMLNAALVLLSLLVILTACGSGNEIADGAKNMKKVLAEVKGNVDSGDAAKVKEGANELEEAWEKFEDGVKDKSKDLYEKAEGPLHAIEAGAAIEPLDQAALQKSIAELDQVLSEIEKL